jgi:hypothetical protein
MATTREAIDLNTLPRAARTELLDFYEFLRSKYGTVAARPTTKTDAAKRLCDRASARAIRLPADYRFDRDEIHER